MPTISVIVPVYNVERYLRKCLDSVVNQTLKNIEVIIVDDGSDDGSAAIADEYAQRYEQFTCIHKTNGGLASARSSGLEIASGEYIVFLDSDDWVDADAYECLYKIAVDNNKPDVIMYRSYDEDTGYYIPKTGYYNREAIEKEILPHLMPDFDHDGKPRYLRFSNCMKIYKRSFLRGAGIQYHDGILIMEDVLFTLDCIDRAQSFYYSDKELYHVTVNPTSLSRTPYSKNKTKSMLLISEYIREYQNRKVGYDYGDKVYSAILYFLITGLGNELEAPTLGQRWKGIRKILNAEVCKWYNQQEKPAIPGWYGEVQQNIAECGAMKMLYRMKYKRKCRQALHKLRRSLFKATK